MRGKKIDAFPNLEELFNKAVFVDLFSIALSQVKLIFFISKHDVSLLLISFFISHLEFLIGKTEKFLKKKMDKTPKTKVCNFNID